MGFSQRKRSFKADPRWQHHFPCFFFVANYGYSLWLNGGLLGKSFIKLVNIPSEYPHDPKKNLRLIPLVWLVKRLNVKHRGSQFTGGFLMLKNPHQECNSELVLMLKKNTQFFHGISTMPSQVQHHFLGSSHTFDASTSFHPGFWLTFPSIFQSTFSHPKTLDLLFFFNVNGSNPKQMRTGGASHFPKQSRLPHPGHPWPRQTETSFTSWQRVEDALDSTEV